jgi:hypothetical protein
MSDKPKILIVGAEDRNIPKDLDSLVKYYHVDQHAKKIPSKCAPGCRAIVLITKFSNRSIRNGAKKLATSRNVPFLKALTGNYIVSELVRCNIITDPKKSKTKVKTVTVPPKSKKQIAEASPPKEETPKKVEASGLSLGDRRDKYFEKMVEFVRASIKPGEKVYEDDLLDMLTWDGGVGLPREECEELLPDLAVYGVIYNTSGKTWRMPKEGELSYDLLDEEEVEPEEVPQEEKVEKTGGTVDSNKKPKIHWVNLLQGLPEGPYPTQASIWKMALKHEEFRRPTGEMLAESYYWQIIPEAIKLGVVRKEGKEFFINRDDSIKLTRREGMENHGIPPSRINKGRRKPSVKQVKKMVRESPHAAPLPKISLAGRYKIKVPTPDLSIAMLIIIKAKVPMSCWDECASRTIARLLRNSQYQIYAKQKSEFSTNEWDYLAWDTLRLMPAGPVLCAMLDKEVSS